MTEAPFFVGYAPRPPGLRGFLTAVSAGFLALMGMSAFLTSRATDDSGAGVFGDETVLSGALELRPYPLLRLAADPQHPAGHTVMLAGDGKFGAQQATMALAGQRIEARGHLVKRGDLDMLLVDSDAGFQAFGAAALPAAAQPLGRWRISGEICDGKCFGGAMHPGAGIAHRACASLCIDGGVPPVFVTTAPLNGASFLLLADSKGDATPDLSRLVALPVTLDGEVERRGDLLVFKVDWNATGGAGK